MYCFYLLKELFGARYAVVDMSDASLSIDDESGGYAEHAPLAG
jgi:hypothetical protein